MRRKQNRTPQSARLNRSGARPRQSTRRGSSACENAAGRIWNTGPCLPIRPGNLMSARQSCQVVPIRWPLKPATHGLSAGCSLAAQASEVARNSPATVVRLERGPPLYRVVAHGQGFTPLPGRGGARNRSDRLTTAISDRDAGKLKPAAQLALQSGLPFNRFTTVHWEAAGVADDLGATGRLLKLMSDWLRSKGQQTAFIWVRENGNGKGAHVHILLHLPPDLVDAFNGRQRGWLTACGARWRKGVLKSRSIGRSYRQALGGGPDYLANLSETVDYVLKGADQGTRERFGIKRSQNGGPVVGKRCSVSRNLGPTACGSALKIQVNTEKFGKSGGDHGRL